jgi:uncharacterized protein (TIGR02001 family)
MYRLLSVLSAAALLAIAAPAFAQAIDGEVGLLSDYRFRGISRSDEDPAAQAALTVSKDSFYAGVRATTLSGHIPDHGDGEFDLYAGWRTDLGGGFDADAGLLYYAFAGADRHADYAEPYASLGYVLGPVQVSAGAKYAPAQRAIGDEDMLYLFGQADISVPLRPWGFTVQAGRQDWGRFGSYWNWSLGARYRLSLLGAADAELGLRYVDTDLPAAHGQDGGLILSAALRF